jgi:excisionase family DNA binding protein
MTTRLLLRNVLSVEETMKQRQAVNDGICGADITEAPQPDFQGRPDDATDVLTPCEASRFLKIGKNALYELCARNAVPHRRVGKQIRFSRTALVRWLGSWSS